MLQIEATLFYDKLGQTLKIGAASLLQIGANVVTNWAAITNWGKILQIRAIITNWGITLLLVHKNVFEVFICII